MCIYTVKKQTLKQILKNPQWGCATPTKVPKFDVSGVEDTAKTIFKILKKVKIQKFNLFLYFKNIFENNFSTFKRELPAEKDTILYLYVT